MLVLLCWIWGQGSKKTSSTDISSVSPNRSDLWSALWGDSSLFNVCNLGFWVPNALVKGNIPWFRDPDPRVQTREQRQTP